MDKTTLSGIRTTLLKQAGGRGENVYLKAKKEDQDPAGAPVAGTPLAENLHTRNGLDELKLRLSGAAGAKELKESRLEIVGFVAAVINNQYSPRTYEMSERVFEAMRQRRGWTKAGGVTLGDLEKMEDIAKELKAADKWQRSNFDKVFDEWHAEVLKSSERLQAMSPEQTENLKEMARETFEGVVTSSPTNKQFKGDLNGLAILSQAGIGPLELKTGKTLERRVR